MIISENQIMQLINIAERYAHFLNLRRNEVSATLSERIKELIDEITRQQSHELREIK